MNSTIPADLLDLKDRFETWRTNQKYVREPIPDELWNAAADLSRRCPPALVGRVLKLDPSRLKKFLIKRPASSSVRKKPQTIFFQLSTELALPEAGSPLPQRPTGSRFQIEQPDGSRLTLTLPSLDLVSISPQLRVSIAKLSSPEPGNKRLDLCGVSRIVVWIFLHQRRRRFYASRRSEAGASGPFLPFSSPVAASTRKADCGR
jgi:hypothetical protein